MNRKIAAAVLIAGLALTMASIVIGSNAANRNTGPADDWFWDLISWCSLAGGLVGVVMFGLGSRRFAQKH